MSNFTGVTFSKQKVLPSDDAIIRRAILSDGILYGCELSYSGSTLTMGAGHLLICGRQARHPSVQNWAVVGATSGYARLVLTVDLSRTASKDYFDQIKDSVEYASAVDGFPDLELADVNVSGTRYQVVACVVSLGTGGITGFVSKLGPCEVAGGGGLNFKLVGGLTQPADPVENTIWVNTDVPITSYSFSATEPTDFTEGMVWIHTGASSTTAFNALRKNAVQVYPNAASQYINGAWVSKDAMMYQNGNWLSWTFYLYDKGVFNNTAGNLVQKAISYNGATPGPITIEKRTGSVSIRPNGGASGLAYFDIPIDLTPYETLCFYGQAEIRASGGSPMCGIGVWNTSFQPVALLEGMRPDGLYTLDISAVSGTHYIGIAVFGFTDYMECILKELYLM